LPVLCFTGALLNIAINNILCLRAGVPLYLDTIFTISVTLLAGPLWGMLTGALTNIIAHSVDFFGGWMGYLFALCSIATALLTHLFVRLFPKELSLSFAHNQQKSQRLNEIMGKVIALILLSFTLCIIMSIMGGLISALIFGVKPDFPEEALVTGTLAPTMFPEDFSPVLREILSRIPVNIVDRFISVFAGFGIAVMVNKIKN